MYTEQERYEFAKKKIRKKRAFFSNVFSWIFTCAFLLFINLKTSPYHLWFIYPFFGWGLAIAFEAWEIYGPNGMLTDEEEQIDKEIEFMKAKRHRRRRTLQAPRTASSSDRREDSALELPVLPKMWNDKDFV